MAKESAVSSKQHGAHRALPPLVTNTVLSGKKALLIGCNYKNNKVYGTLPRTHRDVKELRDLLVAKYHYEKTKITMMLDDGKDERLQPTRANIVREMKNLVAGAKAGDKLFFHFSGHGVQRPCEPMDKTEPDGLDEAIVPCDANTQEETWIIDNDMNKMLVRKIPVNAQLTALFDNCHSGTALDLKHYCYNEGGTVYSLKRTSHDEVQNDVRRLNELSPQQAQSAGENASSSRSTQRKNPRSFSCVKRKSTLRCEYSESSGASRNAEAPLEIKATHRVSSRTKRGGSLDELSALDHEEDQQGFVPPRPADSPAAPQRRVPQRKAKMLPAEQDHAAPTSIGATPSVPDRRHSIATPGERQYSCLSSLSFDWLPHFIKRKFIKSEGKAGEKARRVDFEAYSRVSTATSADHLMASSAGSRSSTISLPTSTSPPSNLSGGTSGTIRRLFKDRRNSVQAMVALGLDPIYEDAQVSVGDMVRCTSPNPMTPTSGSASPTIGYHPFEPPAVRRETDMHSMTRHKCRCGSVPGPQERGQVISISASSDDQLAWDSERGSLTSALVEILKRDAHPTFTSLRRSIQLVLNEISDKMRQYRKREENLAKLKRSAKGKGKQCSRKSGDDIGEDILVAIDRSEPMVSAIEDAGGGPVQEVVIGSEIRFDLKKVQFDP